MDFMILLETLHNNIFGILSNNFECSTSREMPSFSSSSLEGTTSLKEEEAVVAEYTVCLNSLETVSKNFWTLLEKIMNGAWKSRTR